MPIRRKSSGTGEAGSALVAVMGILVVLSTLSFSLLSLSNASSRERVAAARRMNARYVSEAGLAAALTELRQGNSGTIGSQGDPEPFGTATYWVAATDLGDGLTSLVSTGSTGSATERTEIVVAEVSTSLFTWAAFGDESMTMDSNSHVDSYDSSLGLYQLQAVNGQGSDTYANENGDVGSNGNVTLDQNSDVHGGAHAGAGHTTTVSGNATVSGSTTPNPSAVSLPPIVLPSIPSSGPLVIGGGSTHLLTSGEHHHTELEIGTGGTLEVQGPATVIFGSFEMKSNSALTVDGTGGPVEIIVQDDFVMNSNTLISSLTANPADVAIQLLSDNVINPDTPVDLDEVDFESNSELYGTIYAPNAKVEINSNFELFGSLVAHSVHLDSSAKIHYDEALASASDDSLTTWQTVCWRPLSDTQ